MKLLVSLLFFCLFRISSFSQIDLALHSNKPKGEIVSSTIQIKLNNNSLKSYHLVIPNVLETESVVFGSNSFCMTPGQEIYFVYEGRNYLLLTASTSKNQKYNLPKLVRSRRKELGLK